MKNIKSFYKEMKKHNECKPTEAWGKFLNKIEHNILSEDIKNFKNWWAIKQTMAAGNPNIGFTKSHLIELKKHQKWPILEKILNKEFTTNAVNHTYYLLPLINKINTFNNIFEFGGGFGNMCRINHELGFNGEYIIFDFPELLTIQKHYLSDYNFNVKFTCSYNDIDTEGDLFISTHALEESPRATIDKILSKIRNFKNFLFVFSGGQSIFEKFCVENNINYTLKPFISLKGHHIILGEKK